MNGRLLSLDAFRGMTIAAMLLVNNPGDWKHVYGPLLHAPWHGLKSMASVDDCRQTVTGLAQHRHDTQQIHHIEFTQTLAENALALLTTHDFKHHALCCGAHISRI